MKRIKRLIKDIERNGCLEGIGKPEALSDDLQGEYSCRVYDKTAMYTIWKTEKSTLLIVVVVMVINDTYNPISDCCLWGFEK